MRNLFKRVGGVIAVLALALSTVAATPLKRPASGGPEMQTITPTHDLKGVLRWSMALLVSALLVAAATTPSWAEQHPNRRETRTETENPDPWGCMPTMEWPHIARGSEKIWTGSSYENLNGMVQTKLFLECATRINPSFKPYIQLRFGKSRWFGWEEVSSQVLATCLGGTHNSSGSSYSTSVGDVYLTVYCGKDHKGRNKHGSFIELIYTYDCPVGAKHNYINEMRFSVMNGTSGSGYAHRWVFETAPYNYPGEMTCKPSELRTDAIVDADITNPIAELNDLEHAVTSQAPADTSVTNTAIPGLGAWEIALHDQVQNIVDQVPAGSDGPTIVLME